MQFNVAGMRSPQGSSQESFVYDVQSKGNKVSLSPDVQALKVDKLLRSTWWLGSWISAALIALIGLLLPRCTGRGGAPISDTIAPEAVGISGNDRESSDYREPFLGTQGVDDAGPSTSSSARGENGNSGAANGMLSPSKQTRRAGLLGLVSKGGTRKARKEACSPLPAVDEGPEGGSPEEGRLETPSPAKGRVDRSNTKLGSFAVRVQDAAE